MQDAATFWDKAADNYAKTPIADEDAYQYTLNKTRGYLADTDTVLEVGCGTGSTALLLADSVCHITATDISGKMIDIAKDKARTDGVANVTFLKADVLDNSFTSEPYDAVLAHNILHLLEDIPAAIRTVHGHLKPGGLFVSKTVVQFGKGASLKWRLLKLLIPVMQFIGKAPYVQFRSVEDLEAMITAAGFDIIESGTYPKKALTRYIVARKR